MTRVGGSGSTRSRVGVATILAASAIVLTAGYILWMLRRVFFGPFNERWAGLADARGIDLVPLVSLIAVVLIVGIYPRILTDLVSSGVLPLASHASTAAAPEFSGGLAFARHLGGQP